MHLYERTSQRPKRRKRTRRSSLLCAMPCSLSFLLKAHIVTTTHPFSTALLHWFQRHGRSLPWRETKDPYAIWLSEVILQQTRVNQGKRSCRRHRRRSVAPLARFGLLLARSQPAPSGKTDCRIGAFPQHSRGNLQAKRRWSIHVGRHCVYRFQPSSGGSRRQCVSCFGAFLRHRHAHQLHRRQKTVRHLSPIAFAPPRTGTLQRGHHGLWRTAMLAREGRNRQGERQYNRAKRNAHLLQKLSVKWSMRGFCARFGAFATRKNQVASPQTAAHGLHIYKVWGRNCHPKAAGGRHLAGPLGTFAIRRCSTFRCTNTRNQQARGL